MSSLSTILGFPAANLLVPMLLFLLLSPGVLITVPPGDHKKCTFRSAFLHTLVFGLSLFGLRKLFAQAY